MENNRARQRGLRMLGNSCYSGHCVKNDLQNNERTNRKTCMETRESFTEYTTHTHTHTHTHIISHTHLQIIQPYRKLAYIKSKRKPWGSRNNSYSPTNWLCISSHAQILHSTSQHRSNRLPLTPFHKQGGSQPLSNEASLIFRYLGCYFLELI